MRQDFEQIIRRIQHIRNRMEEYILDKGGTVEGYDDTLLGYANAICSIPDFSQIRNGCETFAGNTDLEYIPEILGSGYFTSMYKFAKDCTSLRRVGQLYTNQVTTFVYAFYGCTSLVEIEGIDTSNATTLGECFHYCSSLVRINSPLNVSKVTSQMDSTFTGCSNLVVMEFIGPLKADIWLSGAPNLSLQSLLSVINSLADLNQEAIPTTKKITFGARNKAKLSAAQLALATDKGWTVV